MGIPFFKMQGCGNDYVYLNAFDAMPEAPEVLARRMSNRNFGVGSDGLILLAPPEHGGDVRMIMYNADGSEAEMCGNGVRCLAKLAYDLGITKRTELAVETRGGIRLIELIFRESEVVGARVDMGRPRFEREAIPMRGRGPSVDVRLDLGASDEEPIIGTGVSMGNPHFVVFPNVAINDELVLGLGPKLERHPEFPERANIEFVDMVGRSAFRMRVWERGSGETMACGTGACAALAAAVMTRRSERRAIAHLRGGDLEIEWPSDESSVLMTGPATLVFRGEMA